MKKKIVSLVLVFAMALALGIGGTIAWLTDKTETVTNTFTVGNIDITLKETKNDFKMVPGSEIEKDPKVTVKGGSEACWLFVKIEESDNLDDFITYAVATGWTELTEGSGVYYREVAASDADQPFAVIGNKGFDGKSEFVADKVLVNEDVTKDDLQAVKETNKPTLSFTAYAVQKENIATAAAAWEIAVPTTPAA